MVDIFTNPLCESRFDELKVESEYKVRRNSNK